LVARGVEVITDRDHLVHVSGHPRRAELQDMIGWVRPRILIPAHGEALHMAAHAALARQAGVPRVITCRDGDLVRLAPQAGIIDELPAGRLYKDGSLLIGAQERTVADRRRLGFAGLVSVALTLSHKGELMTGPRIALTGIPDADAAGTPMLQIVHESVLAAFKSMPKPHRRDPDAVAESLRRAVRSAIGAAWKKKPICHVHVLTV
jgi:ribonuclease J